MDVKAPNLSCLQGRTVTLPGSHDKEGRPILLITIPLDSPHVDVILPLQYIISIFSESTQVRGVTVIIDARKGPWKVVRSCIKQVSTVFISEESVQLLVLKPDTFLDKQRVESCTQTENKVIFTSRLNKFVDQAQLPIELGGNFIYNHDKWIENRQKVENFFNEADFIVKSLEEIEGYFSYCKNLRGCILEEGLHKAAEMAENTRLLVYKLTENGQVLIEHIEHGNRTRKFDSDFDSYSTPQETTDTINKIDKLLNNVKTKQSIIEKDWVKMQKTLIDTKDLTLLEEGVVKVTNWILGPAENLLNSKQAVGFDVFSAEELRREHESFELQCWDTYGAYAELLHKIAIFEKSETPNSQYKDLISQKDFMNFVCRSFALRLEKRRNILITSLRFFRLVSEYFDKTGEVFDSLVLPEHKPENFPHAKKKLQQLQENQIHLENVLVELIKEGEKLSDMLSMPVKDAFGREVIVDYAEDIINVRDILDATTARKNIFSDSIDLQKLTLEQINHIYNYEEDIKQAISWLDDIFNVLFKGYSHVGCSVYEIQSQKEEHLTMQETAKDTYNYGLQLLHASLQLRQSCKLSQLDHDVLSANLKSSWKRLLDVSQEQMTRLRVSAVFHRSVEEQCNQLRDLREAVATIPLMEVAKKRVRVRCYFEAREKLMVEVGRMVRLGRLLRSRLKEPLFSNNLSASSSSSKPPNCEELEDITSEEEESLSSAGDNEVAIEAISERLSEITDLAEELDQALHSAQQDCCILTISSATSASVSSSDPETVVSFKFRNMEQAEPQKQEMRSDDEFVTASESTLQHSRSSSYNTASECENRYSPWWEYDKDNMNEDLHKEKMVLAVGLPNLPQVADVLKPSPEVPPGKIAREVTETTHIKVQHSHTLGVASFVLTSETVCEKSARVLDEHGQATGVPSTLLGDDEMEKRMKEVGCSEEEDDWKMYAARQALKGFI